MSYPDGLNIMSTGLSWPSVQPGGLNTYFKSVCEQLSSRNRVQALICTKEMPATPEELIIHNAGDPKESIWKRKDAFQRKAADMFNSGKERIDILYSHFAPYGVGPAIEAKKRGIPVVMTFHGPWNEEMKIEGQGIKHQVKTAIAKSIERKAYRLADKFIVLSETFRDILHSLHGIPLDKIVIIPGAANIDRFIPSSNRLAVRRMLNLPEGATTVLTVRRLVNRMGLLQLLEAWRSVSERFPNAILLIGGKGPLRAELEGRIADYGLTSKVRLLGYIPDHELASYYQAADLFVVPSQALEGFGLITTEALASGLPVMATPIGGNREILQNFRPELLFKSSSAADMAEGISHMLGNRRLLPSREECREHVLERYTWEHVADQVEAVFREVMGKGETLDAESGIYRSHG
ncbi:glycosyltransferase family 4 protein [Paenibacillus sp. 7124]|uniref:Glycosyltransferase family 4 protein n=1 Tax=Paenibacillus apii TaxID=1850370 RepID=A0A6M1PS83_9BACL|nr:glycosyltransferase family 4 protein [Paenibacillus apii]NGM84872.1 glycosyltransferase family 4 protein [Paenibacillus apii]NJJ41874.1 glycosyltransferase family 4 protein [Paenibacillus apii]